MSIHIGAKENEIAETVLFLVILCVQNILQKRSLKDQHAIMKSVTCSAILELTKENECLYKEQEWAFPLFRYTLMN